MINKSTARTVFTATAAAEATGVSVSTLKNLERSGIITPARDTAGRRLYIAPDLEKVRAYYRNRLLKESDK